MKGCISVCHDDETLIAELSFWATSAGYEIVRHQAGSVADAVAAGKFAGAVLQLSGTGDGEIDLIEALSRSTKGRIVVVSTLDTKTISSLRRLFQEKSIEAIMVSRAEFCTRQLADVLRTKEKRPDLDRQTLADAIAQGHVVVHYQPKVPFRPESRSYGVEALCRIQHPELGLIYPDNFIPLAEAHDLILQLTDAVTTQAFRALRGWDGRGTVLRLALNISPRLMSDMAWFELFEHRCQEFQVDPSRITLEVTESSSQNGKGHALEILSRLRLKGFMLSIDDFGTGFSSLETLYKLPFGELKIDKGFVFDLHKSPEARTLVESTVSLARKLGLKICAEGVETEELFQELRNLQCDDAQGYFISKPIADAGIPEFFEQWDEKRRLSDGGGNKLQAIHGLLAEILTGEDDGDDATIVIGSESAGKAAGESATDIASRIPALVMGGDLIGAMAFTQRAVARSGGNSSLTHKLRSLQSELARSLAPQSAELVTTHAVRQLVAKTSITIGRESASSGGDIAIPCRWLSRASKNLSLSLKDGQWEITDLGSTNGHFVNGSRLAAQEPFSLPMGETMVEVGKVGTEAAPAWLLFRVGQDNSVELSFGVSGSSDDTASAIHRGWIVFGEEFSIGHHRDAGLVAPVASADFVADVRWQDGALWLSPRAGQVVRMGDHEFTQMVPLAVGQEMEVGNMAFSVAPAGSTAMPSQPAQIASACA